MYKKKISILCLLVTCLLLASGVSSVASAWSDKEISNLGNAENLARPSPGLLSSNNWTKMAVGNVPSKRSFSAMAYDPESDRIILFGGSWYGGSNYNPLDDTWAYDYNTDTWTNMTTGVKPPARYFHSMVYYPKIDRIVMFGGYTSGPPWALNDAWTYDYNTNAWKQMFPSVKPPGTMSHTMAYDSESDRFVMFSGVIVGSYTDETWSYNYNTNNWTKMFPSVKPEARESHAMAYDAADDRMIMFGGNCVSTGFSNETWSYNYNTNNWTKMFPSNKMAVRYGPAMTYDPRYEQVIMVGGYFQPPSYADDTWFYNFKTNNWTKMYPSSRPDGRMNYAIAYDNESQRTIIFGGAAGTVPQYNDTWAYESPDILAPTIKNTSPSSGAVNVSLGSKIMITWSEGMNQSTAQGAVSFVPTVSCAWSWTGNAMTCTPSTNLQLNTNYSITVSTAAKDIAGNAMAVPYQFYFHTILAPTVTVTYPANNSVNVSVSSSITIKFSKGMNRTETEGAIAAKPSITWTASWGSGDTNLTLTPQANLLPGTKYTINVTTAAKSADGANMLSLYSFVFTTEIPPPAPIITSTTPTNNSINVSVNASVTIEFSEQMDENVTQGAVSSSPTIIGSFSWANSSTALTLDPNTPLLTGTKYAVNVSTAAKSKAGKNMLDLYSFSFTTAGNPPIPPAVASTSPINGEINVSITKAISITFTEVMNKSATEGAITSTPAISGSFSWDGTFRSVTWSPSASLQFDTKYTVKVSKAAKSQVGIQMKNAYSFAFTTEKAPSPPKVVSTDPANGTTKVPPDTNITITFSKSMNKGATEGAITSKPAFAWISSWGSGDKVLTIDPYTDLAPSTGYNFTIDTTAKGSDGSALASPYTFSFTTSASVDTTPPTIATTNPADGQKEVDPSQKISITFSERMDTKSVESALSISPGSITKMEWGANGKTVNLTASLAAGTKYVVTIATSAKDLASNHIVTAYSFSFETKSGAGLFGDQISMILILLIVIVIVVALAFALMRRKKAEGTEKSEPDESEEEKKEDGGKADEQAKDEESKTDGEKAAEPEEEGEKPEVEGKKEDTGPKA